MPSICGVTVHRREFPGPPFCCRVMWVGEVAEELYTIIDPMIEEVNRGFQPCPSQPRHPAAKCVLTLFWFHQYRPHFIDPSDTVAQTASKQLIVSGDYTLDIISPT